MSGNSSYQPQSAFMKWLERRLPIGSLIYTSFVAYPTPRNLNYWWTFGGILTFMLGVQIVTGVVLAMHYVPHVDFAFDSVEHLMRDVNYGWLLRYIHASGASFFFVAVYIHMARAMYYGSYKDPREVLWILGVILFLLMIMTGFVGYVLPWGQMSFWAATVITNLFSAIPVVGNSIVTWLWGGFAVGDPTLNRFYALHYLLPFIIAGVVVLHIWALHVVGQNNPTGVEPQTDKEVVAFTPYATIKDAFFIGVFCIVFAWFVFYIPNYLLASDNFIPANPEQTPTRIYCARMVLSAVLRDPARHPQQTPWCNRTRRLDHRAGIHALARYLAGAFSQLSTAVPAVFVHFLCSRHWARFSRGTGAGGWLCDRGTHSHHLLFRVFLRDPAAAGTVRKNQTGTELDF
jgi:ubiquinol-cytochrome c reductase cytochrome b/c1 subunit